MVQYKNNFSRIFAFTFLTNSEFSGFLQEILESVVLFNLEILEYLEAILDAMVFLMGLLGFLLNCAKKFRALAFVSLGSGTLELLRVILTILEFLVVML